MFGSWKSRTVRFRILLCGSRDFFTDEQLRQEAVEALHYDSQAFAHVLDGLSDLHAFMLALAFGVFSQRRLSSTQQIAKNRHEFPADS